jgi:hypothetical protein
MSSFKTVHIGGKRHFLSPRLVQEDFVSYEEKISITESSSFFKPWRYRQHYNQIEDVKQLQTENFPHYSGCEVEKVKICV